MAGILFILSGGTIDAEPYAATPKNITPLSESVVPQAVEAMGLAAGCRFQKWKMKDSKDFTDADMQELAQLVKESPEHTVIITHGTDHMPQNSRRLAELLKGTDKRVVFTGAMEPLSHGPSSDGFGNLTTAITEAAGKTAGVHVVMHSQWFPPEGLRKHFETKTFYISGDKSVLLPSGVSR
jgi:L-asparaginase/Glu-tRNA(Gln) amidotransferase subunit D